MPKWIPPHQWTELEKVFPFLHSSTLRVKHPNPNIEIKYKKYMPSGILVSEGVLKPINPFDTFEFYLPGSLDLYSPEEVWVTYGY